MNTTEPMPLAALPAPQLAIRPAVQAHEAMPHRQTRPVDLLALGRETVARITAYPGAALGASLILCASGSPLALSVSFLSGARSSSIPWPILLSAVLGLLVWPLGQGALAWIGLQNPHGCTGLSFRGSMRAAARRWPVLVIASGLSAIGTFLCAVSLTPLLGHAGLGVPDTGPIYPNPDGMPRLVAARSLDAVVLGPLHPLAGMVAPARAGWMQFTRQSTGALTVDGLLSHLLDAAAAPDVQTARAMAYRLHALYDMDIKPPPAAPYEWLLAVIGLGVWIAGDMLPRFWPAASMHTAGQQGPSSSSIWAALRENAHLGFRHTGVVMAHTWLLRLAVGVVQIACVILPVVVADNVAVPQVVWLTGVVWLGPACRWLSAVGSALVGAGLVAACVLYDTRLFVALQQQCPQMDSGKPA